MAAASSYSHIYVYYSIQGLDLRVHQVARAVAIGVPHASSVDEM